MITTGDFRDQSCPLDATLLLVDPPYGIGKKYIGSGDSRPYVEWVQDVVDWAGHKVPTILIMGPGATLVDWLPLVPRPDRLLWWHRTFLLPRKGLSLWAHSLTPILVYREEGAAWYGPTRQERGFHDVIDAHSSLGDNARLRKVFPNRDMPKHPAATGTQIAKKLIEPLTKENDLVIDPMCGIGSIPVVCQRLGRRFLGIEIEDDYASAARRWLDYERELRRD